MRHISWINRRPWRIGLLTVALLLLSQPLGAFSAPRQASDVVHVVQRGEYLNLISLQYGVETASIMRANGIVDANRIYIGQRLIIPPASRSAEAPSSTEEASSCPSYYRVRVGDYLAKIAYQYGITVASIQQANSIRGTLIFPGTRLQIPCSQTQVSSTPLSCPLTSGKYLVRPGDTLFRIALRCETTVANLRRANGLDRDLILAGQWLAVGPRPEAATLQPALSSGATIPTPISTPEPTPTPQPTRLIIRSMTLPTVTASG
jgi:lysozyme